MRMTRIGDWGWRAGFCALAVCLLLFPGRETAAQPVEGAQQERPSFLPPPIRKNPWAQGGAQSVAPGTTAVNPAAPRPDAATAPTPERPGPVVSKEGKVALNFDNADVNAVIASISEIIGIPYVADPGIQGTVTIRTAGGIAKEDLLPVLYLILEVNGLTAVKDGDFYRITTSQEASHLPIRLRNQRDGEQGGDRQEIVTQIIPLQYVSAGEMGKLLEPFLSPGATLISHEGTNTLLVVDTAANAARALKLVETFDTSLLESTKHRFFFLKRADPQEIVDVLKEVFAPGSGRPEGLKLIPIPRLYAFLALSNDERTFDRVELLLASLDAATESTEPRLHVYFVRNGTALNLAGLLEQVFSSAVAAGEEKPSSTGGSATDGSRRARNTLPNPLLKDGARRDAPAPTPPAEPAPAADGKGEESGGKNVVLTNPIRITPDEIRNALIIEATPADYRVILSILESIDVLPRQVLIEATVAEIDYSIISELGVNWEFLKGADFGTGLLNLTSTGETGLRFAVGITDELRAALRALENENKVNIINSPHVLASDNQEARIDVSQEIPVVSAETVVPSGGDSIVTTTVQYRDTGVLLSVTPHINDRKLVSMDIYQEVSEQAESVVVAGSLYPSFFKRVVRTTLTVEHGQTIVLGGLIRENRSKGNSGVPCLVRMPLLGPLFGQRRNSLDKTELIILLTPKVIVNRDEIDSVTQDFKARVESVVEGMKKMREVPFSPLLDDVMNRDQ